MLWRFRNIWDNVGAYQFFRMAISLLALFVVPVLLSRNGTISRLMIGPVAFFVTMALRGVITQRPAISLQILRAVGFFLFACFVAWVVFRAKLPQSLGAPFFALFGLYMGSYFWLMSDPRLSYAIFMARALENNS